MKLKKLANLILIAVAAITIFGMLAFLLIPLL